MYVKEGSRWHWVLKPHRRISTGHFAQEQVPEPARAAFVDDPEVPETQLGVSETELTGKDNTVPMPIHNRALWKSRIWLEITDRARPGFERTFRTLWRAFSAITDLPYIRTVRSPVPG